MTLSRFQVLERLGYSAAYDAVPFSGIGSRSAAWEDRLSELGNYRNIHGNCNVPGSKSGNFKLATWVAQQRYQYRLQQERKTSQMTLSRIQALESLGFEWNPYSSRIKGTRKTPSLDDDMRRAHKKSVNSRQGANYQLETASSTVVITATGYH
jgi:hypothetical protein